MIQDTPLQDASLLDSFDVIPGLQGGMDAESLLVQKLVDHIDVPPEILDWCLFAGQYCTEDGYGQQLAAQVLSYYKISSGSFTKRVLEALEAVALKKKFGAIQFGGGGQGGRV